MTEKEIRLINELIHLHVFRSVALLKNDQNKADEIDTEIISTLKELKQDATS